MRQANSQFVTGGTVGTASFISSAVWSYDIIKASFQFTMSSGSLNGTFNIQGSNDLSQGLPPNMFTPTNWNTITSASVVASSTAAGQTFMILPIDCCYEYLRLSFTAGNGGAALGLVNGRIKTIGI